MGQVTINSISETKWFVSVKFPSIYVDMEMRASTPGNPEIWKASHPSGNAQQITLARDASITLRNLYFYRIDGGDPQNFVLPNSDKLNTYTITLPDQARAAHGISGIMADPEGTNVTIGDGQG